MRDERRPASIPTALRRHLTVIDGGGETGPPDQQGEGALDEYTRDLDEHDVAALRAFSASAPIWLQRLHTESPVRRFTERSLGLARRVLVANGHDLLEVREECR